MLKLILQSIRQTLVWTAIAGVAYPMLVTVIAQAAFKDQANGSLVFRDGKLVGSALLAQQFTGPTYFWPRPSAGTYATVPSGASNLGPTSAALQTNVANNLKALRDAHKLAADAQAALIPTLARRGPGFRLEGSRRRGGLRKKR
jgi:K+-transporting ATPase ATPase C chain